MIRALYTASSGMVAQALKQDVIANNIANAQTPGFKRERVVSRSFTDTLNQSLVTIGTASQSSYSTLSASSVIPEAEQGYDSSEGPIISTESPVQFAIDGPGSFEVESNGVMRQTRNGNFKIDQDGELATTDGAKVQGQSGSISVPQNGWYVTSDGSVVDKKSGITVDRIKITGAETGKTQILQGSLEESNVSVVREMVDMISNLRSFETNQKVISSVDSTLDKLINEAGKV